jgi:hypothetical protein
MNKEKKIQLLNQSANEIENAQLMLLSQNALIQECLVLFSIRGADEEYNLVLDMENLKDLFSLEQRIDSIAIEYKRAIELMISIKKKTEVSK